MTHSQLLDSDALRSDYQSHGRFLKEWGQAVAARRKELKFSRETLASLCGTSTATIGRIEQGALNPRDYMRSQISRALGSEVCDLFGYMPTQRLSDEYSLDEPAAA